MKELGGASTYMSHFISVEIIIMETSAYLDSKDRPYKVPSTRMLAYHFSRNHEHRKMYTMFTGKLGTKQKTQNRNAQANHGHGQWVTKLNQYRCYSLVMIRNLVEEARCDTQSVSKMMPWDVAIHAVDLDDKAGIPVGWKVALYATKRQSGRTIVRERDETVARDHSLNVTKFLHLSFINRMLQNMWKHLNVVVDLREMEPLLWYCMTQHLSHQQASLFVTIWKKIHK